MFLNHPPLPDGVYHSVEDRGGGTGERTVNAIRERTRELWLITLVGFVGGDLLTTAVGLSGGGVVEVGPLAVHFIEWFGLGAMIPLKLLALGACLLIWRAVPKPHDVGVPLGLAVFGVLVTAWNAYVLVLAGHLSF